ncbi:MAG: aminotransferase class I/II-fold pyridoxal phosphate-dependent enzyme [Gemmatimonadetes bacterium]|nr:aminotransferase class I/II-fold pyridoxal phosphate-dependent enzyme [Gemmatimonadota bacterium]
MAVSRRSFIASVGAGTAGALALPLAPNWRGYEALGAALPQDAQQTQQQLETRRADRLLAARPGMIRIDSNENPNGPGARVFEAIKAHFSESNRYPVRGEDELVAAICKVHGVKPENVMLGCGSGELLRAAVRAFTSAEHGLVSPNPTFEAPGNFAKFIGSPVIAPPVDGKLRLDLDAMVAGARGAGLVFFCNPNNPTATVHGKGAVTSFVEQVNRTSPETTILVDEAYHEYVADASYATSVPLALANPRVFVTRTFSKVFGMAGLRAGYAIGRKETLARMQPWLLGSNVNQLALAAATTAIADAAHIGREQRLNREARAYTRTFFEDAGYTVFGSDANFMMVDIRKDARAFKTELLGKGVAVGRAFPPLNTHLRISVGTMAEMKKALAVIKPTLA